MAAHCCETIDFFFSSPSSESLGVRFSLGTSLFPVPFAAIFFSMAFSMASGWSNASIFTACKEYNYWKERQS